MKKKLIIPLVLTALVMVSSSAVNSFYSKNPVFPGITAYASSDTIIGEMDDFLYSDTSRQIILGLSETGKTKYNNASVAKLEIPAGVTQISGTSFQNKTFSQISFPESLTKIFPSVFHGTTVKSGLHLPSTLQTIDFGVFQGASIEGDVILPEQMKNLGDAAFYLATVNNLNTPSSVETLGANIFQELEVKEQLYIKSDVNFDWKEDFKHIHADTLRIGEGITEIPSEAFRKSFNPIHGARFKKPMFRKVILPNTIKSIGSQAFFEADVQEVNFPEGLEEIGINAFRLSTLKEAILPNSLKTIGYSALGDTHLEKIKLPNGIEKIDTMTFSYSYTADKTKAATELIIPESVKGIENEAFLNHNIKSLRIPKNVKEISMRAFADNDELKSLSFEDRTEDLRIGGDTFKNTSLRIIEVPAELSIVSYSFGNPSTSDYPKSDNFGWDRQIYKDNQLPPAVSGFKPKVAVYRVNKDKTGYLYDDKLKYEETIVESSFVVNPVSVQFRYKNSEIPAELKDAVILVQSSRDASKTYEYSLKSLMLPDIKLGDKLTVAFKNPKLAEKYEFALPDGKGYSSIKDLALIANYRSSASDLIQDVYYSDRAAGYDLPYKQALFTIREKSSGDTGTPITPPEDTPKKPDTETPPSKTPDDGTPEKPSTPIEEPPKEKPTDNTTFQPSVITNADKIPNNVEDPVFQIVTEDGTPLGNAVIDLENNTYTFVDDDLTPLGIAQINDNNELDILEIFEDQIPQTLLPKTGDTQNLALLLTISLFSGLILIKTRKGLQSK